MMRLRVVVLLIIVLSLVLRVTSRETYVELVDFDAKQGMVEAIEKASGQVLENTNDPFLLSGRMVYFQEPGCAQRSVAFPFALVADSKAIAVRIDGPSWDSSIHYFDQTLDRQDRASLFASWARQRVLSAFGLASFTPATRAVFYSAPPECMAKSDIDWRTVWLPRETT